MCSSLLLAAVVLAPQPELPPLPFVDRYDAAWAQAKERNVPVLVLDFDGWANGASDGPLEAFFTDRDFLRQAEAAVLVLASQDDHGRERQLLDGVEREVCAKFGVVSCDSHRDMLPKVFSDFGRDGVLVSPLFVVAGPDRKELARFEHEQTPSTISASLVAAGRTLGPGLPRRDWVALTQGARELERLIELHEPAAAVALLAQLRKIPGRFAPHEEVDRLAAKLEESGTKRLARAQELFAAGRALDGLIEADDVKACFGKLACADAAAAQVTAWEKDPAHKPLLRELKEHRSARQLYLSAVELDRAGDARRAVSALDRLLRQFPESRFTDRARSLRDGLESEGGRKG